MIAHAPRLAAMLLLVGCSTINPSATFLDGPYESAVLEGGPFDAPVGFVSNMRWVDKGSLKFTS